MSWWPRPLARTLAVGAIALSPVIARAEGLAADVPRLPATKVEAPPASDALVSEDHDWLRIVAPTTIAPSVEALVDEANLARAHLAALLDADVLPHVELRIARTVEEMALFSPKEAPPPAGSESVAYPPLHLVVVERPIGADPEAVTIAMRHALAHLALFDAVAAHPTPAWFQEGFATASAREPSFADARTLAGAVFADRMLPLGSLDRAVGGEADGIARAEATDFVRFLAREERGHFGRAIARMRVGDPFETAVAVSYGRDARAVEDQWRADVSRRYVRTPLYVATAIGWGLAVIATVVAIRRRRRAAFRRAVTDLRARALERAAAEAEKIKLVCVEAREGALVFVEPKVPTVEHDGKVHTLH